MKQQWKKTYCESVDIKSIIQKDNVECKVKLFLLYGVQ